MQIQFPALALILVALGFLSACSSTTTQPQTSVQMYVRDPVNPAKYRIQPVAFSRVGYTRMHWAVELDPYDIFELAETGWELNGFNEQGFTPLHLAVLINPEAIIPLIISGADFELGISERVSCAFKNRQNKVVEAGSSAEQLATLCNEIASAQFQLFAEVNPEWLSVRDSGLPERYQSFIQKHQGNWFGKVAMLELDEVTRRFDLQQRAAEVGCKAPLARWYVTAGECDNGLKFLQGEGIVETMEGIRFEGQFSEGIIVSGKMQYMDEGLFQGEFVDGRPYGDGMCWHESKPEQCSYYEGERIDQLFKMRQEWARQSSEMRRINAYAMRSHVSYPTSTSSSLFSDNPSERKTAQARLLLELFNYMARKR